MLGYLVKPEKRFWSHFRQTLESMANRREGQLPKNNDPEIVASIRPAHSGRIGATICHTQNESQNCEKSMKLP